MSCCRSDKDLNASLYKDKARENFEKKWKLILRDTAKLSDFEIIRTIGVGAFGRVLCVKNLKNQKYYALKALKKEKIVRLEQVQRVHYEKRILQSVVSPFLVDLRFVFKTNSYLFLVMPMIRGGEIYSYLKTLRHFSEHQTRFYSAQIILAFQYLHSLNVVYRDLKPENVLLECDGYIKIIDYGFAKRLEGDKTTSFVGTPEYMAPEMLIKTRRAEGYSCSVDWWTLGIFVYECITGEPPFAGASLLQLFDSIVKKRYRPSAEIGPNVIDLIDNLLQVDVAERLGCKGKGSEELKKHVFFAGLNWHALYEKKITPEFVPPCQGDDFTKNFERFEELPFHETEVEEFVDEFKEF
ncbi:cAMP-dependent protein kinase catalytic subunit gamma-like [Planococcus citri]|uniref:cAMP-dependent protein kinase catalytic subunit gamma-like n=1 Tax=Planococcus citri TaxID=170843 RepID=UPI0031F94ED6